MTRALLVIVLGPPGSGKTTLARSLAEALSWPLFNRDGLKETLFDTLGWSDRAWSRKLGYASYELLLHIIARLLPAGAPFIVESNFNPALGTGRLQVLQQQYGFYAFQLLCTADQDTLVHRFRQRALSGERHPGHVDADNQAEIEAALTAYATIPLAQRFLDLEGECQVVDTTHPLTADERDSLTIRLQRVEQALERSTQPGPLGPSLE